MLPPKISSFSSAPSSGSSFGELWACKKPIWAWRRFLMLKWWQFPSYTTLRWQMLKHYIIWSFTCHLHNFYLQFHTNSWFRFESDWEKLVTRSHKPINIYIVVCRFIGNIMLPWRARPLLFAWFNSLSTYKVYVSFFFSLYQIFFNHSSCSGWIRKEYGRKTPYFSQP